MVLNIFGICIFIVVIMAFVSLSALLVKWYHRPVQTILPTVRGAVRSGRALRRWRILDEPISSLNVMGGMALLRQRLGRGGKGLLSALWSVLILRIETPHNFSRLYG